MPSRKLTILTLGSLLLLVGLAVAWIWSYVETAPDAYSTANDSRYMRARSRLNGTPSHMTEARRNAQQNLRALAEQRKREPYHWLRLHKSGETTTFLASSRGSVLLIEYYARATLSATGHAIVEAPGFWKIDGDTLISGRPSTRFGSQERRGINMNGWQIGHRSFAVPYWMLCMVTLIAPSWWVLARRRAHRAIRQNRCVSCGYDLRASPDRCPECGTPRAFGRT